MAWPFVFATQPTGNVPAADLDANFNAAVMGKNAGGFTLNYLTNSLGADVALNNTALYFDGPQVAQGASGVWWASGTVCCFDASTNGIFSVKLWDGATVISSVQGINAINWTLPFALSGFIVAPTGNIRISARCLTSVAGVMAFNASGLSMDSTISVLRIG